MHWSLFVLAGAVLNVAVNLGYKTASAKENIYLFAGLVMLVAAISLISYSLYLRGPRLGDVMVGWAPYIILGMGIGSALILYCLMSAFANGPLTLIDPLWACVYALGSAGVGMMLLREGPSLMALSGIGLYLVGAFLMARG